MLNAPRCVFVATAACRPIDIRYIFILILSPPLDPLDCFAQNIDGIPSCRVSHAICMILYMTMIIGSKSCNVIKLSFIIVYPLSWHTYIHTTTYEHTHTDQKCSKRYSLDQSVWSYYKNHLIIS